MSTADASTTAARDSRLAVFARLPDPHDLAERLTKVLAIPPIDAMIVARHVPGVLTPSMTAAEADQLVEELHEAGVQALRVVAADLPDLEQPTVVHHARCLDNGWELVDLYGSSVELVPWNQIAVLAAGAVPGDVVHRFTEQGRPSIVSAAPMPEIHGVDRTDTDALELWVLRRNPSTAYRIEHRRFNYESLKDPKTDSATTNFALMLNDLASHATTARRSPSTHAYLAHDLRSKYGFASSADLQQQALLQWVIACSPS